MIFHIPPVHAQISTPSVSYVNTPPSGACLPGSIIQVVSSTGIIYTCQNRVWGQVSGSGTGSAVNSVFGRTGNVIAANNDYMVSQVTGAAPLDSPVFTGTVQADEIVANDFIGALNGVAIEGQGTVGNVLVLTSPIHAVWGNNVPTGTGFYFVNNGVRDSVAHTILPQDLPATINSSTTGNSATTSAFTRNPSSCQPVSGVTTYPTGVDAQGNATGCSSPTGSGQPGSVTTITVDDIPELANTTVTNASTTPHVSFTLNGVPAHSFLGNNTDTENGLPSFSGITIADLPEEIAGIQAHNMVWASPDATNGIPTFRSLLPSDINGLPNSTTIFFNGVGEGTIGYIPTTTNITLTAANSLDFITHGTTRQMNLDTLGNLNFGVNLGKFMDTNRNIFVGSAGISGNSGLPEQVNGGLWLASGLPSPVIGRIYVGDGSGWHIDFARRIGSIDTPLISFFDTGAATFTGNVTAPTFIGSLQGNATTATTATNLTGSITESQVTGLVSDLALKAPLASPALTGVPTAPTAASNTNTTQIATTAMVQAAIATETPVTEIFGQVTITAGASEGNDSSHASISISSVCVASPMNPISGTANLNPWEFVINLSPSNISIIAQNVMAQKQVYSYMCRP